MQHSKTIGKSVLALIVSGCLAGSTSTRAFAQTSAIDNEAEKQVANAAQVVELPSLIFDLFRSTPRQITGPGLKPNRSQQRVAPSTNATQAAAALSSKQTAIATTGAFVPDEVLVTINGDEQEAQDLASAFGLQLRSVRTSFLLGTSVVRLGIPDGRAVGLVLAQLRQDGQTIGSEPNHIYTLQQGEAISGYTFENINFDAAKANGSNVRVAVIDTARDKNHSALSHIIADDFDALPDVPVTNTDHGTSIVGLVAGQDSFQGVAPGAHIFHARAFENGKSNTEAILFALDWSAEQNAQIINMSFVGPRNKLFEQACNAAFERGILLVAAAGNNGPKAAAAYPGAYKSVVAVTATDEQNRRMAQANIGSYIAMSAPGVGVLAPIPGGGFDLVTGTSFAAAIYSGAIANLMQRDPAKSAFEIERIVSKTALDLGAKGKDVEFGAGLLDFKSATLASNQ